MGRKAVELPPEVPALQVSGSSASVPYQGIPARAETTPSGRPALTPDQKAEVERLQKRDAEVRAHEAAHQAAAGAAGGAASFSYTTGPDGRSYAVGGEVHVQMPAARTPEEAIRNAQRMRAAALAPADPSGQDRAVAADAAAVEMAARAQQMVRDRAEGPDAERTLVQLQSERRLANDLGHAHGEPCGFCAAAAARYR
jgi:hypothetical protein